MSEFFEHAASYLGIKKEIAVTISVSIIVFVLGILINSSIYILRKYKERSIYRRISKINHKLLIDKLRIEAKNLKDIADQLTIDHLGSFLYKWETIPSINIFKDIGYPTLFQAYFTGFENFFTFSRKAKIEAFNDLWLIIEFLSFNHSDSRVKGEKYIEMNGKLNELRNVDSAKAQRIIEDFRISFHKQLGYNEPLGIFFGNRERIMKDFERTPNNYLPTNTNEYLNRILQLNRDNVDLLNRYKSDTNPVELNSYILSSNYRYENQKNHIEAANFYFDNLYDSYIKSIEDLIRSFKILNFSLISFSAKKIRPYFVIQVRVIYKKFSLKR